MSKDKPKLNMRYLKDDHQYWLDVAKDKNLSIAAKGLLLILRNIPPFLSDIELIQNRCNSDEKEIYAAITELANNGYLKFSEVEMYIRHERSKE